MSYHEALKAAGANVKKFANFGDWQGTWLAYVEYKGEEGWISGAFGSCTHCDAFEAEFGYFDNDDTYEERLKAFGESYLTDIRTTENVLREYSNAPSWDEEAVEICNFINSVTYNSSTYK